MVTLYPTLNYATANLNNLRNFLGTNQFIDGNRCNHKTGALTANFHKPAGEENLYVQFGYVPQKKFNHIQGQVSGLMNADTINMIHTQVINKIYVFNEELEGDKNLYWLNCSSRNQE